MIACSLAIRVAIGLFRPCRLVMLQRAGLIMSRALDSELLAALKIMGLAAIDLEIRSLR